MSIRLNKACRELNIGLKTACEYLYTLGDGLENVKPEPSFKLSDVQYNALVENFPDRIMSIAAFAESKGESTIDSVIQYAQSKDLFLPDDPNHMLSTEELAVLDPLHFRSVKIKVTASPTVEQINKEVNVFRLKHESQIMPISVLGKINLDSLNTTARPQKKTHEQRREERLENNRKKTENISSKVKRPTNTNLLMIRDIWQRFIDIQEKLIKQKCLPISIDTKSIEIDDDKLYVTVDESRSNQQIESILKGQLGVDEYDLESGSIFVDEEKWNSLTESELSQIRKDLSACYIELDTTPAINATINYSNGMARSDQMSLEELHQLESIIKNGNLIEGSIDDQTVFISKVSVQREDLLKHLFGDHYKIYERKKMDKNQESSKIMEVFEYHNQYIPWKIYTQYQNIGLQCQQYVLIFKVYDERANNVLKDTYDCWYPNTDTFEFKRNYTKEFPFGKEFLSEVNENITAFLNEASLYCSKNDINIEVVFTYSISKYKLIRNQLHEVATALAGREGYSFNEETGAIGIDFNWRKQDISDLISEVESWVPFIKVNVFEEHRLKCNVNTRIVGFNEIKQALEDKYEDIDVVNDSIFHQIKIKLPYVEADFYDMLCSRLRNDLLQISVVGIEVSFAPKLNGKIRLSVNYNAESRLEDLEDTITDMKRADFGFILGDKEVIFGKLLKVNYPNLIFDINVEDEKKKDIINAFESKAVNTIVPILTGDLEKISRLKNTFTMATTGQELVNPRLQNFIFDSSQATKTQDIDLLLRPNGSVYKELCEHLLNPHVNESQKQAIIKAMFADDLAVIQGPPGTGKSTAIAELIWQLIRKGLQHGNKRERILLTSETNLAVDNAISRIINRETNLVKPVRFGGEEKLESEGLQFSIELMKRWVEEGDSCLAIEESDKENDLHVESDLILKNWLNNISNRSFYGGNEDNPTIQKWRNYLEHPSKQLRKIAYDRYMENVNVIGATCSSIGARKAGESKFVKYTPFFHNFCEVFKIKYKNKAQIEFTTVIQDESSKATPAELVLPFVYGNRAIIIGDHRQLPPMLDQEEFEDTLDFAYKLAKDENDQNEVTQLEKYVEEHFDEMEISHFQRLYENIDNSLKGTFNLQYRMHPDINDVIEQFYQEDGGLYCGLTYPKDLGVNDPDMTNPASRYHGLDIKGLIDHDTHVLFINTTSPEMLDGKSRVNYGEVETLDHLLTRFESSSTFKKYLSKFSREEDKQIGIISFYGKQIRQLKLVAFEHKEIPTRVSTVDRFQGMERNIVIVSMVRSNIIQSFKNQQPDKKRYPKYGYPEQHSLGFAQSPNRLNVALSRAKRLLIIVGNREHFSNLEIYRRLFLTIESNKNNRVVNQEEV
jgi:superfamily I DNA and/or RNA helicase